MKIVSSEVQLASQHTKQQQEVERERLRVWVGNPGAPARQPAEQGAARFPAGEPMRISPQAQALQPVKQTKGLDDEVEPVVDAKLQALITMIERLTGKKFKFFGAEDMAKNQSVDAAGPPSGQPPARAGWGMEYDYYHARMETEQTRFQAQGVVKTADGQEINISLELGMSRRFMEEQQVHVRAGDARLKDPLVINFSGTAAELSETKFSFDIDSDGREDQISLLDSNSGYLALDKNGDGAINDGSELFGTQSGNGFADLAAFDEDGNNWIDENDSIYSSLRIWNRDADGNDQLFALGQKDVGAIYLGNIDTAFDLKDSSNEMHGQIASSGIYLKDSGGVGTVQQLNLVV